MSARDFPTAGSSDLATVGNDGARADIETEFFEAFLGLYCAFGPSTDPIVADWWEARAPEYEDMPGSEQIRQMALKRARHALVREGFDQ